MNPALRIQELEEQLSIARSTIDRLWALLQGEEGDPSLMYTDLGVMVAETSTPPPVPLVRPPVKTPLQPPKQLKTPIVDKSNQKLTFIEAEMVQGQEIERLYLQQNQLVDLPVDLFSRLSSLVSLNVSFNRFLVLPSEIGQLEHLTELLLEGNEVAELPFSMTALTGLKVLNVMNNFLDKVPSVVPMLLGLSHLCLRRNDLLEIPVSLTSLRCLEVLDLGENALVGLPRGLLAQMPALRVLEIDQNAIRELPHQLGESLVELTAFENRLTGLPASIGALTRLEVLMLNDNAIEALPDEIGQCAALTVIGLKRNALSSLNDEHVAQLKNMVELDLTANKLVALPLGLGTSMPQLTTLLVGDNKLVHVPDSIVALRRLRVFACFGNAKLGALPDGMSLLPKLRTMHIAFCPKLTSLGVAIQLDDDTTEEDSNVDQDVLEGDATLDRSLRGPFRALRELHLAGCRALPPLFDMGVGGALGIGGGAALTELYAAMSSSAMCNDNGALLPALGRRAPRLERLDVADCKIQDVAVVGEMSSLSRLNVQHNVLTTVPRELASLALLEELDCSLNAGLIDMDDALLNKPELELFVDLTPLDTPPEQERVPYTMSPLLPYGFAEMLGRRPSQEDALTLVGDFPKGGSLFCVFDGHAGHGASRFCARMFPAHLERAVHAAPGSPLDAMRDATASLATAFRESVDDLEPGAKHCGTTALMVWCLERVLYIANLGDTRAVLCRGGKALRVSKDHKPRDEEPRIRALGGHVMGKTTQRLNGMLAVPRTIGDFFVKPLASEEPYLAAVPLQDDDDFLILACDGVWDELSDQRAVDVCRQEDTPQAAAIRLRDVAFLTGSDDNISSVVVLLREQGLAGRPTRIKRKKSRMKKAQTLK